MSWTGRGGRRSYHHGNLREALINAALDLISTKGPAGFTFAEAARAAGVSPAAPYRHFRDRDALLADVALQGFDAFEKALREAWDGGRPSPMPAFERLGRAYLEFARSQPAYFSAMFESGLSFADYPAVRDVGDRAFGQSSTRDDDGPAHLVAVAWHRCFVRSWRCRSPSDPDDSGRVA